jgi:hypothetical protein
VDNNYLDLGINKSGFVHTLPSGRLRPWGSPPPPRPSHLGRGKITLGLRRVREVEPPRFRKPHW